MSLMEDATPRLDIVLALMDIQDLPVQVSSLSKGMLISNDPQGRRNLVSWRPGTHQ